MKSPPAPTQPPRQSTQRSDLVLAAAIGILLPIMFAAITHQAWEDYFITFRSSRNLAEGHGLVYQIGNRVHTFTSPLGVLIPALGFLVTQSDAGALWFLRALSALALSGTAWIMMKHAKEQNWPRPIAWFLVCSGLFEAKTIAFSSNGMETGLLVFFTAWTWRELTRPQRINFWRLACGYAALMWTRPDAWIVAAAMTISWSSFRPRTECIRTWRFSVIVAIGIGAALYLPWVIWAWHYYGSPIPQTIIAKSALMPADSSIVRILSAPIHLLTNRTALDSLWMPPYATIGGWSPLLLDILSLLARIGTILWLFPSIPRMARAASLSLLIGGIYLYQIMPYPWYFAPWTLLGAYALASTLNNIAKDEWTKPISSVRVFCAVTIALIAGLLSCEMWRARFQQQLIEDKGRKQIGCWLKAHAMGTDTVFCEPIGYIGYFSQLRILDYPGLCAPEVSRIVRRGHGTYRTIFDELHPTWLVLRPYEIINQRLDQDNRLSDYKFIRKWSCRDELQEFSIPGQASVEFDSVFLLFHKSESERQN